MQWTGGTLDATAGPLTNTGHLDVTANTTATGTILNAVTGVIEIHGDVNVTGDSAVIDNSGLIRKVVGTGTSNIETVNRPGGVVEAKVGTLIPMGPHTGGDYRAAAGASVTIAGVNLTGTFSGGGGGEIAFNQPVAGATSIGSAGLVLNFPADAIRWRAGTYNLGGPVTNAGFIIFTGSGDQFFTGQHPINNNGTITLANGRIVSTVGTYINNHVGGVIDITIEINGAIYDRLAVNGTVTLGGNLAVSQLTVPQLNAEAIILANDGIEPIGGTFVNLPQGAKFNAGGTTYVISYTAGDGNDIGLKAVSLPAATAPVVAAMTVNDGELQRSRVTSLRVTFDRIVDMPSGPATAFVLTRVGPGGPTGSVDLIADTSPSTPTQTIVRLTFIGDLTDGTGSVLEGRYDFRVLASEVSASAVALDGNGDGTPGDDYVSPSGGIIRFSGDADGNGAVNFADFLLFRSSFGNAKFDPGFDFDADGDVDFVDFLMFRSRFGAVLP